MISGTNAEINIGALSWTDKTDREMEEFEYKIYLCKLCLHVMVLKHGTDDLVCLLVSWTAVPQMIKEIT